jgi:adenine-specific DNA methylase
MADKQEDFFAQFQTPPVDEAKLRGGYYTPGEIAEWLCRWAIRSADDTVLEPSCGNGEFLLAAAQRLTKLGASRRCIANQLVGIEIIAREASEAQRNLSRFLTNRAESVVACRDFFIWEAENPKALYRCVVGNPPFIRYQQFPEPSRSLAMSAMERLGLHPNRLTNAWVPFVACSVAHLAPGGRIAIVLPAELLQVSYAAQLRRFLTEHFKTIDIIACNSLLFDRAEQEVVLVVAQGRCEPALLKGACSIDLLEVSHLNQVRPEDLLPSSRPRRRKKVNHESEKWLKYFLTPREIDFMREIRRTATVGTLSEHASVDVGVVTGKNKYFVLSAEETQRFGLKNQCLAHLVGRSAHLRGASLTKEEFRELATRGESVFLFYVKPALSTPLPQAVKSYIALGLQAKVHKGYKCSIRDPWYSVPSVWAPDCFLFRQIYDFPRMVVNLTDATSTDTIHRVKCIGDPALVASNAYTHLTAASAEIEGRSYGGGVLELEPSEAENLLIPRKLQAGLPISEIDSLVRRGKLDAALEKNDKLILVRALGLSSRECALLRRIWVKMRDRRINRKKHPENGQSCGGSPLYRS